MEKSGFNRGKNGEKTVIKANQNVVKYDKKTLFPI